jgi:prepilin-type N-terminal cleavage/methylation domain-containing protein
MRQSERGFTLIEMMTVVVIIGVMSALTFAYVNAQSKAVDVATRVGELFREASRQAVALGPVRADVALALGSTSRTRITATGAAGGSPVFTLSKLVENPLPANTATWVVVQSYAVVASVIGDSWSTSIGSHAAVTLNTAWSSLTTDCYANGTCQARSLFFIGNAQAGSSGKYARVSVMPIGGAVMINPDWN